MENNLGQSPPLVDQIKFVRVAVDGLMANAEANKCSGESTLAWRSLQMGKSWLGKALGALNQPNPYPPSETAKGIPPTADTAGKPTVLIGKDPDEYTRFLNEQRHELEGIIGHPVFYSFHHQDLLSSGANIAIYAAAIQNSNKHLVEAKFWLGFELGAVREKANL